MRNVSTYVKW